MFELVRANRRRSWILIFGMLLVLLSLGFVIGAAVVPSFSASSMVDDEVQVQWRFDPVPGLTGMGIAFALWFVQCLIAYFQGGNILLYMSGATRIAHEDNPQLYNVVEEMSIAAGLPKPPDVYVMDDMAMNAFATGHGPENGAVAVTAGLLARLNRDQLQGVVAHEIAHLVHRDVLFMTLAGIMLGTVVMITDGFMRMTWHTRHSSSNSKNNGANLALMVLALVLAIVAPLLAQMFYFACSRRREYLADAGGAVYTRYPEGLASALEAISGTSPAVENANRATAPMYIINPLQSGTLSFSGLFSTHPPTEERIRILRSMGNEASYRSYGNAWNQTSGSAYIPATAMSGPAQSVREASAQAAPPERTRKTQQQQMREVGDMLRKVNQFTFLACACGLRVKVPPQLRDTAIACPRCQRALNIAQAQTASSAGISNMPNPVAAGEAPLQITHTGGWMSFQCSCGAKKELGPAFHAAQTTCAQCGRVIRVVRPQ